MTVTEQAYEWVNVAPNGNSGTGFSIGREVNAWAVAITANQPVDIFTGKIGNNISTQPRVGILDFVVIEYLACSPQRDGAVQIRINNTDYFQNPDDITTGRNINGIPGLASPYPCGTQQGQDMTHLPAVRTGPSVVNKFFNLEPPVYILPGQTWSILYTTGTGIRGTAGVTNDSAVVAVIVKYTLYHGTDALIANRLLEIGMPVTSDNSQWLKRTIRKGGTL